MKVDVVCLAPVPIEVESIDGRALVIQVANAKPCVGGPLAAVIDMSSKVDEVVPIASLSVGITKINRGVASWVANPVFLSVACT